MILNYLSLCNCIAWDKNFKVYVWSVGENCEIVVGLSGLKKPKQNKKQKEKHCPNCIKAYELEMVHESVMNCTSPMDKQTNNNNNKHTSLFCKGP